MCPDIRRPRYTVSTQMPFGFTSSRKLSAITFKACFVALYCPTSGCLTVSPTLFSFQVPEKRLEVLLTSEVDLKACYL